MSILIFLAALLASTTLTRMVRDFSVAQGWVSIPVSERQVHTRPTPRLVGLIDDFCGLSAYIKFAAQAVAAAFLFVNGVGISQLSLFSGHPHVGRLVGLLLTILWVLWITNAFNLIDGLDGLAA